jgi:hypothetical protein
VALDDEDVRHTPHPAPPDRCLGPERTPPRDHDDVGLLSLEDRNDARRDRIVVPEDIASAWKPEPRKEDVRVADLDVPCATRDGSRGVYDE